MGLVTMTMELSKLDTKTPIGRNETTSYQLEKVAAGSRYWESIRTQHEHSKHEVDLSVKLEIVRGRARGLRVTALLIGYCGVVVDEGIGLQVPASM